MFSPNDWDQLSAHCRARPNGFGAVYFAAFPLGSPLSTTSGRQVPQWPLRLFKIAGRSLATSARSIFGSASLSLFFYTAPTYPRVRPYCVQLPSCVLDSKGRGPPMDSRAWSVCLQESATGVFYFTSWGLVLDSLLPTRFVSGVT